MNPDETVSRSPLDKPLYELTEEDISQLTREDCRKFLRDKGMRRPSWNKSQAIEQVISLKTLLEVRPESDSNAGSWQKFHLPRRENSTPLGPSSNKGNVADLQVPANENVSCRKQDVAASNPVHNNNITSNRKMDLANGFVGQMTIFYCGKVNVYDGMPADKALAIMQFAASSRNVPQESPPSGTAMVQSVGCQLRGASIRSGLAFASSASPSMYNGVAGNSQQFREEAALSCEVELEGPMSRKASVQRYLEKRKDRFKNKRKIGSSSSLEMYLNHHLRDQNPHEQSNQSRACSPPQPRPPHTPTRCSSVENQAKQVAFSFDLNENDAREA